MSVFCVYFSVARPGARHQPSSLVQCVVAETEEGGCGVTLSLTTHPGPVTCVGVMSLLVDEHDKVF